MKRAICLLLILTIMLTACSGREAEMKTRIELLDFYEKDAGNPVSEENEIFDPLSGRTAWLDGGNTLAVQEGFTIKYLNRNNELINEIKLSAESLYGPSDCVFANYGIFMGEFKENYPLHEPRTSVCYVDGEWKLYGGVFFDREGNIIHEQPYVWAIYPGENEYMAALSTGETIAFDENVLPIERMLWINEEVAAFFSGRHLFFYNLETEELKLAGDIFLDEEGNSLAV